MTPEPIVRNQGVALALTLLLCAALEIWTVAAIGTALTAIVAAAVRLDYRRRRGAWTAPDLPSTRVRARLDRLIDRTTLAVFGAASCGAAIGLAARPDLDGGIPATSAATALLLVSGGMYWSSLVDWFWVLPRISGLHGHRSCRNDPDSGAEPVDWEGVTRWWLVHRVAAAVCVALGVAGLLATLAGLVARVAKADPAAQAMVAALVLFVGTAVQIYRQHAAQAWELILHPEVKVGVAFEDLERGACLPVDIALEGMKVINLSAHADRVRDAILSEESPRFTSDKGDYTIPLSELIARRSGVAESSCRGCTGINWYCIENPDAWYKTRGEAKRRHPELVGGR